VLSQDAPVAERVSAGWLLALSVLSAEPEQPRIYIELIDVEKNARKHSYTLDIDVGRLEADAAPLWQQIGNDLAQLLRGRESSEMNEAWAYYFQGREQQRLPPSRTTLDRARLFFTDAIAADGNFARAYAGICEVGLAEIRMNDDWGALNSSRISEPCYKALELDPDSWEARLAMGSFYRLNDQETEAIRQFEQALQLEPEEPAIDAEWGKALAQIGEPEAEQRFKSAIAKGNGFWGGYLDLANYYFDTGRLEEAKSVLKAHKSLFPDLRLWLMTSGAINFLLDDWEEASTDFFSVYQLDDAIAQNSERFDRSSWLSRVYLGTMDYYHGCYDSAAQFQREAIAIQGRQASADLLNRYAEACSASGRANDDDAALAAARDAFDLAIRRDTVKTTLAGFRADRWQSEEWRRYADAALYSAHRNNCRRSSDQPECREARLIADRIRSTADSKPEAYSEAFYFAALIYTHTGNDPAARQSVTAAAENGYSKNILVNDPVLTAARTNQVDVLSGISRLQKNCPELTIDPCVPLDIGSARP
jgi:hypothetical protein